MDRTLHTLCNLAEHYESMDLTVRSYPEGEWGQAPLPDPTNNRIFGWIPPYDDGSNLVFAFCPDVIVDQTTDLDDFFFAAYIDVIRFTSDMAIAFCEIKDDYERARMIDKQLFDTAQGSMQLLNQVQMRALDMAMTG